MTGQEVTISTRARGATPSPTRPFTFEIQKLAAARGLPEIIPLSMGQVHTDPHPLFLQDKSYHYSASVGDDQTLAVLVKRFKHQYLPTIDFSATNVICILGQEQGFFDVAYLLIDPDDVILSFQPNSLYSAQLKFRGGRLESAEQENFIEYLKRTIAAKTKAILLNNEEPLSNVDINNLIALLKINPHVAIIIESSSNRVLLEQAPSLWKRCIILAPDINGLAMGNIDWRDILSNFHYLCISCPPLSTQEMIVENPDSVAMGEDWKDPKQRNDYSANAGDEETLGAIVKLYQRWYPNIKFTKKNVMPTLGATQALFNIVNILGEILEPGDEVAVFVPCFWGLYPRQFETVGIKLVGIPTIDTDFRPTAKKLEEAILNGAKGILLNDPNNPTGVSLTRKELQEFAEVLKRYPKVFIILDDSNKGLSYLPQKVNIFDVYPKLWEEGRAFIITSCTKDTGGMPGARMGMVATNEKWRGLMADFQGISIPGPSLHIQGMISKIAKHIDDPAVKKWSQACYTEFKENCQYMYLAFQRLGLSPLHEPQGSFFVFPCVERFIGLEIPDSVSLLGTDGTPIIINDIHKTVGTVIDTDARLVKYLIYVARVATLPGSAYQKEPLEKAFLRVSCAQDKVVLKKAIKKITQALRFLELSKTPVPAGHKPLMPRL